MSVGPLPETPPSPEPDSLGAETATATRERILDAAEVLFAERGFRATSVRRITRDARCNLAAVNYHFGGKSKLYREVVRRRLVAVRERRIAALRRSVEAAGDQVDLELLLRRFTDSFVEPLVKESGGRTWLRLMAWELVDRHLPREMLWVEFMQPVQQSLVEALSSVCPGLSGETAALCAHSLVAQLVHIVQLNRYFEDNRGARGPDRMPLERLVRHAVRFSAAAIRELAPGDATSPPTGN